MRINLILALCWLMALAQAAQVPVASVANARAELEHMLETNQQYRSELAELLQEKGAADP